jgi:hypothetical protein
MTPDLRRLILAFAAAPPAEVAAYFVCDSIERMKSGQLAVDDYPHPTDGSRTYRPRKSRKS